MKKKRLKFSKSEGRIFVGSYAPGDTISHEVEIGDLVSLEESWVTMLVRVNSASGNRYAGTIESFENYVDETYKGYQCGDEVDFTYDDIHGCHK